VGVKKVICIGPEPYVSTHQPPLENYKRVSDLKGGDALISYSGSLKIFKTKRNPGSLFFKPIGSE
jgi:hypothetical protein